jgi:hypothetical protein
MDALGQMNRLAAGLGRAILPMPQRLDEKANVFSIACGLRSDTLEQRLDDDEARTSFIGTIAPLIGRRR